MKGVSDSEKQDVIDRYAAFTPQQNEDLVKSYEERQAYIDYRMSSLDTFYDLVDPFLPTILEKRSSLATQHVTILYQSTQSLERRLKGKLDEPIMTITFEPLDQNSTLVKSSKAAKQALKSNNRTTLICVGTFMPTSMMPGMPNGTPDSVKYHSITGINLK